MKLVLVQPQLSADPAADNIATIKAELESAQPDLGSDDIILLPEGVDRRPSGYERDIGALARHFGCHVVGGSRREIAAERTTNAGLVFNPEGSITCRYEKMRPYAVEREVVRPGTTLGEVTIAGRRILVLVCADFWFADLFQRASRLPDVVLVAALSVTRKSGPEYSRSLWQHLAIARAYEFGVYVGISDWGYPSNFPSRFPCGVGGLADPTVTDPELLFRPTGDRTVAVHDLDFESLAAFRRDRVDRGFFWKEP